MPADGHPALKTDDISLLRAWIEQGASPTMTSLAGINLRGAVAGAAEEQVGDYSALLPEIRQMEQSQGAKLFPVSANPADGLILSTINVAPTFNDAQLASFAKFAPFIVEADLARTAVTDASFDTLCKFTRLRALHLEGTAITGRGLEKLTSLSRLSYLNLSETKVDLSTLAFIHSMPNLRHVYLFDTPAQPSVK